MSSNGEGCFACGRSMRDDDHDVLCSPCGAEATKSVAIAGYHVVGQIALAFAYDGARLRLAAVGAAGNGSMVSVADWVGFAYARRAA